MFCDLSALASLRRRRQRLSVPSSSGNVLRLSQSQPTQRSTVSSFSPLLIGECSATQTSRLRRLCAIEHLSVPSSSGNVLRLKRTSALIRIRRYAFQSPPHRGMFCDCRIACVIRCARIVFQSPPHRGMFCDIRHLGRPAGSQLPPFSPLLIGECSATTTTASVTDGSASAFSPLLIGECSATLAACSIGAAPHASRTFSPLLIGECSATDHRVECQRGDWSSFQSPPHRGMFCD